MSTTSPLIPQRPKDANPAPQRDPRQRTPEYTVVRLVNRGPESFHARYNAQEFYADPGEQIYVPFYAMCLWAGHPDAVDVRDGNGRVDKKRQYRTDELKRLQVKYGTHSFNGCWTTEICDGNPGMSRHGGGMQPKHPPHRHLPNVDFYHVEDDQPYNTVLRDPHGTSITETVITQQDDLASRAMRDLQTQVDKLQKDLAAMHAGAGADVPPPAPIPQVPPMPAGDGRIARNDDDDNPPTPTSRGNMREDGWPETGPLEHPIPVNVPPSSSPSSRKPRIPPAPGPLNEQ